MIHITHIVQNLFGNRIISVHGAGKKSVNSTGVYHYFKQYNLTKNIKGAKKFKTFF